MPHGDRSEDSKEQIALKKRLSEALKEEGNNGCAECGSKQPRWASTNLGVFVCIRCSGIHRNLGVHISKVKSVTLDSWTPPLVEFMEEMGNDKANAYWEANLPTGRKPRESDSTYTVEAFMREKYERRKFVDADEEQPAAKETKPKKKKKKVVQETEEGDDDHAHGEPGEEGQSHHSKSSHHHKHKKHHKQSKHKGAQHEAEDVESAFQKLRATEVEGATSTSLSQAKPKQTPQSQSSGQPDLLPNIASLGQQAQQSKSAQSDFDVFTSAGSASGAGSSAGFSAFFSDGPAPTSSSSTQQATKPTTSSLDLFASLSGPSQSQPQPQQSVQQQQVAPKPAGPGTKDILAMFDGPRFPSAQQQPQMMPMQMQMQSNPYGSSMYPSLGRGAPQMMMQPQQQPMMMQPMRQPVPMSGYGQPQVSGMYPQLQSQPQGYGMSLTQKPSLSDISSMYGPTQPSPASRSSLSMMPQAQPTYSLNMNLSMTMSGAQAQSTSFAFSTGPSSRPAPQPQQQQKSSNDFSLL